MATRISQIASGASLLLGLVLSAGVSVHAQTIIYVDQSASGPTHDGSSWCNANLEVHEALDVATSGAVIRVADGTYLPDTAGLPDPREATFGLLDGVALEGGYAGCGAADPDERDIALYETILSGDLAGDDGPDFTNNDENSYHVVTGSGTDATAVLDGFTITGGNADGPSGADYHRGGGMYNNAGGPTVTYCTFSGNTANNTGGGMENRNNSPSTLAYCTFHGNTTKYGGGINNVDSNLTATNCTFKDNSAGYRVGGMRNVSGDLTLANCTFVGNSAPTHCGGMLLGEANATVVNCVFTGNSTGGNGGGILITGSANRTLTNCTLRANSAADNGGGIYNQDDANVMLTSSILWGNSDASGSGELAQIGFGSATVIVNYCCVAGWTGGLGGTGNIGDDPDFAFPDDAHLMAGSPCIDAGTNGPPGGLPPTDLDGNARPLDGDGIGGAVADMGAYEFNPQAPSIAVFPLGMEFSAIEGGANPGNQTLSICNCGGGTLSWEVTEDCSWLEAAPPAGDSAGETDNVTISVNVAGLAQCEHRCALTVSDTQAVNTPREVEVVLRFPVLYVDDDASTGGDGLAWATAYKYLQDALWAAGTNGTISEIRIAQGTYKPDQDEGGHVTPGDRTASFGLMSGVALTGGYAGIGAPAPDARDIEAYETIFSGDLAGDDGPDFANNGENSYHVVTGGVIDATAVLDGVTITGGNGTQGGGVYLVGVDTSLSSDPTLVNCTVCANRADTGGGMYFYRSAASLTGCTLSGNSASDGGGFAARSGGYVLGPTFLGCTVSGNSASNNGGGGYVSFEVVLEMQDCTLSDNTAVGDGGGLHLSQDTNAYYVINCVLRKNSAGGDGGAVYSNAGMGGFAGFTNCVFSGNQASGDGGAYRDPGWFSHQGFARCTFNGNTASHGGAISVDGDESAVSVNNCIAWGDSGGELDIGPYTGLTMNYSDVNQSLPGAGTGNIRQDPRFVDPDGPDGIYGTEDDNLRLQPASPCINTGDPAFVPDPGETDLDGHSRVLCGRLDMGAYEFGIGDYQCDLDVDLDDFDYWDDCMTGPDAGPYDPGCEAFDFEFDGDVDLDDFRGFQQLFEGG